MAVPLMNTWRNESEQSQHIALQDVPLLQHWNCIQLDFLAKKLTNTMFKFTLQQEQQPSWSDYNLTTKKCTVVQIHKLNNTIDTARKLNIQDASSSTTILDSIDITSQECGFKLKTLAL